MFERTSAIALASLLSACGPDLALVGEDDGALVEVEGELCSRADLGGLTEGTPEARAVLKVANTLSRAALRTEAKLTATAAKNIALRRDGADLAPGTSDDRPFTSLADLSGVCQVGNAAMRTLGAFAQAQGYVAAERTPALPFEPCTGDLSPVELMGLHQQAWLTVRADRWTRTCHEVQGVATCEAWVKGPMDGAPKVYGSRPLSENAAFAVTVDVAGDGSVLKLTNPQTSSYWARGWTQATADGRTQATVKLSYRGFNNVCDDYSWGGGAGSGGCLRSHYEYFNAQWLTLEGTVTERCLRVADEKSVSQETVFGPGVRSYVESVRTLTSTP